MTAMPAGGLRDVLPRRHHLVSVQPHNGAHRVALRAALSVGIPLLALWLTGRLALSPYAAFGAFASLYGRSEAHAARLKMQLQAGAALTFAVTAGTAVGCFPDRRWLAVPAITACAAAGSLAADRLRWHPPGPIFVVFGSAVVASIAAVPARIPVAFAVAASAALLAAAIGTAGRLRQSVRVARVDQPTTADALGSQAARYSVAVLLSGAAATATGIGHPYWAMVAAVAAVTGPDTAARVTRAVHRAVGTLAGVLVAAVLLAPHPGAAAIIAAVIVLQAGAELLVGRNYGLAMLCITPLAMLMGSLAQPVGEWTLLRDRTVETLLGAAIGIVVSLAVHRSAGQEPSSAG